MYFDDTNPLKEKEEYVNSIMEDIQWLGFRWDKIYFASDHYERLYNIACKLISKGKAYVCHLRPEEMREYRGTLVEVGKDSPFRNRSIEENMEFFTQMKEGKYPDGHCTLRAKIDMSSSVICMRDPVIYRIMHVSHYRTGDKWCIYPMYDFASPLVDAIEEVTHSLCGIEFEDHRHLYDWVIREAGEFPEPPKQIEFAKIKLTRTLLGKRFIKGLVEKGVVSGWDDPRMATLSGMRRKGYPPAAIRRFMEMVGVARCNSLVEFSYLEHFVREELSYANRRMVVLNPIKLCIDNYPDNLVEEAIIENHPELSEKGRRRVIFSKNLYIEAEDFLLEAPKKFFRMTPGAEVRLKGAYIVRCTGVEILENGETIVHCSRDEEKSIGNDPRKVKGTIHWVSADFAIPVEVRQYDHLLKEVDEEESDYDERLNPKSLEILNGFAEKELYLAALGESFQFLRHGYYCLDKDSKEDKLIFNRTVSLNVSWKKV